MDHDGHRLWNTRMLMTASAAFMAVVGLAAAFFPQEILASLGYPAEGFGVVLLKVVGALYVGLAILNWLGRGNAIGGIYSRPVAMANFVHFLAVGLVFLRHLPDTPHLTAYIVPGAVNGAFAGAFGWLLFCGREPGEGASCG